MQIHSLCPFRVGTLVWEAQPGQLSLSVTVKATLNLVHEGEALPAPQDNQVDISNDLYWEENDQGSLYRPSDLAPLKRRVDILLSGHAYASNKSPVESLVAKLRVGDFDKSIRVTGDRCWTKALAGPAGTPGALVVDRPLPFLRMPLRYERAAQSVDNPVGIDPRKPPVLGQLALPNLEPIEPESTPTFGAIASTWPSRRKLLSEEALAWAYSVSEKTTKGPTPSGFNFEFFNTAPREQQVELLRAGTRIELDGLSPARAHLETYLPPLRPQVFRIHPSSGRPEEIVLRCDTLWIDSDHGIAVLSFRGLTDVGGMDQGAIGTLVVASDPQGKRLRFEKLEKQLREILPESLGPSTSRRDSSDEGVDPLSLRHDGVKPAQAARASSGSSVTPLAMASLSSSTEDAQRLESLGFPTAPASEGAPSSRGDDDEEDDDEYDQTQNVVRAPRRSRSTHAAPPSLASSVAASSPTAPPRMEARERMQDQAPAHPHVLAPSHDDGLHAEARERAHAPHVPAPRRTNSPAPIVPPPFEARPATVPPPRPAGARPASIPPPPPPIGARPPTAPPPPPPIGVRPPTVPPSPGAPQPANAPRPLAIPPPRIRPRLPSDAPSSSDAEELLSEDMEEVDADAITGERAARSSPGVTSRLLSPKSGSAAVTALVKARAPADAPDADRTAVSPLAPSTHASGNPAEAPAAGPMERIHASISVEDASSTEKTREPESGPDPAQVPIERYATVSAELAQKGAERSVVLRGHKFTVAAWAAVDRHWTRAIAEQTERGERTLLSAFDAAYVATQERLRRPIGVHEYARILVGLERGEVGRVLAELELQLSDLMRLQRVWSKKIADTPNLATELQKATEDARRTPAGA